MGTMHMHGPILIVLVLGGKMQFCLYTDRWSEQRSWIPLGGWNLRLSSGVFENGGGGAGERSVLLLMYLFSNPPFTPHICMNTR